MRAHLRGVGRLVALRLLMMALTTLAVTALVFALAAHSPLDPLAAHLGSSYARHTEADRAALSHALGMDRPWWQQWASWWADALHADFGFSRLYQQPVLHVVAERLPWTLLLSGASLLATILLTLVVGWQLALRPTGRLAQIVRAGAVLLAGLPAYVLALSALLVCAVWLHWVPLGGAAPVGKVPELGSIGLYLITPALVLAVSQLSWPVLALQESLAEACASPAVTAARMRGLPKHSVAWGHVLPVSMLPLITALGSRLGELIVGAVIVESIFSWPGLAEATVQAAVAVDFPLLAFITAATTVLVMLGALLSDIAYLLVDPRVSDV